MKKFRAILAVAIAVYWALPALAQSPSTFRWRGVANAPPEATETSYYLHHAKPSDLLARDALFECRKGDAAIDAYFVSVTKGGYRPEELANAEAEAVFVVDGKRLAPVSVRLLQEEGFGKDPLTLAIRYNLEVDEPLFQALVKGKSFRFELPKATSHTIPLAGFAKHALAMKKQCFS
ncbi:MAG: hypothetical protein ACK4MV_20875 [Beijerinckiaceae bacterium]